MTGEIGALLTPSPPQPSADGTVAGRNTPLRVTLGTGAAPTVTSLATTRRRRLPGVEGRTPGVELTEAGATGVPGTGVRTAGTVTQLNELMVTIVWTVGPGNRSIVRTREMMGALMTSPEKGGLMLSMIGGEDRAALDPVRIARTLCLGNRSTVSAGEAIGMGQTNPEIESRMLSMTGREGAAVLGPVVIAGTVMESCLRAGPGRGAVRTEHGRGTNAGELGIVILRTDSDTAEVMDRVTQTAGVTSSHGWESEAGGDQMPGRLYDVPGLGGMTRERTARRRATEERPGVQTSAELGDTTVTA